LVYGDKEIKDAAEIRIREYEINNAEQIRRNQRKKDAFFTDIMRKIEEEKHCFGELMEKCQVYFSYVIY